MAPFSDEAPVLHDLAMAGIPAPDLWDIPQEDWKACTPIFIRHLQRPGYSETTRAALANHLCIRECRAETRRAWDTVTKLMYAEPPGEAKDLLLAAISYAAGDRQFDELVAIACDRSLGDGRLWLVDRLGRMANGKGLPTLEGLVDDPDVGANARAAVERIRRRAARG